MKKLLILFSFLFVTMLYAAPPPDVGDDLIAVTTLVAAEDAFSLDVVINVQEPGIEAQEVAVIDIGNPAVLFSQAEKVNRYELITGRPASFYLYATSTLVNNESPPMTYGMGYDNQRTNYLRQIKTETNSCFGNFSYPIRAV